MIQCSVWHKSSKNLTASEGSFQNVANFVRKLSRYLAIFFTPSTVPLFLATITNAY